MLLACVSVLQTYQITNSWYGEISIIQWRSVVCQELHQLYSLHYPQNSILHSQISRWEMSFTFGMIFNRLISCMGLQHAWGLLVNDSVAMLVCGIVSGYIVTSGHNTMCSRVTNSLEKWSTYKCASALSKQSIQHTTWVIKDI